MPKSLPQRLAADTCGEFLAAAECRYEEGLTLYDAGWRAGAIYLWGYSAEMLLKAAVFRAMGSSLRDEIRKDDLEAARSLARQNNLRWNGNYHFLPGWAELLLFVRTSVPGLRFRDVSLGSTIQFHAIEVNRFWRETIRYHKNIAYRWEAARVRQSVEWLLGNVQVL